MTTTACQRPQNKVVSAIAGRKIRKGPASSTGSSSHRDTRAAVQIASASSQHAQAIRHRVSRRERWTGAGGEAAARGQDAVRSVSAITLPRQDSIELDRSYQTTPGIATDPHGSGVTCRSGPYLTIQRDDLRLVGHARVVARTAGGQGLLGHKIHLPAPDGFVDAVFGGAWHSEFLIQNFQSRDQLCPGCRVTV